MLNAKIKLAMLKLFLEYPKVIVSKSIKTVA